MSDLSGLAELVKEVRAASENMAAADETTRQRIDAIEKSLNVLLLKANRPGAEMTASDGELFDRNARPSSASPSATSPCRKTRALPTMCHHLRKLTMRFVPAAGCAICGASAMRRGSTRSNAKVCRILV